MEPKKNDYGINTQENIKHLEDYLENDPRRFPERLRSESVSSDTLEALQNAERLVQEAKRIIAEAQRRVLLSKTVSEDVKIMDLNDEELEIKYIVAAKFDEANGRKVKTQLENVFHRENSRIREFEIDRMSEKKQKECKKNSTKSPRRQIHSLHNIKLQRGPQIDIRNDLSLRKIETLEINPQILPTRINTGTFQLRHNTRKVDWIDEPTSFIDTGVQTSLRDSSESPKFEDALSRSGKPDLDQNKIDKFPGSSSGGIKNDGMTGKIDDEGLEHFKNIKKSKRLGQKSFMDFLCGIKGLEVEEKSEKPKNNSSTSLNSSIISLKTPKIDNFDELLSRIDKKLEIITQKTENFDELCKENCGKVNNEDRNIKIDGLEGKNSSEYGLEVLLQPRSRVSSSSSGVSEALHPAISSTPLNNWKIEGESSVKLQINDAKGIVISASAPVISDFKNIEGNFIDGIVPMTRNKLSYEKNIVSSSSGENSETVSLFPTYSSEKSNESHRSEFKSLRIDRESKDSSRSEIKMKNSEVLEEFPVDLARDNEKNSENFSTISRDRNPHISSGRDGTSHDISKLSSVVVEESCNSLKSFNGSGREKESLKESGDGDLAGETQQIVSGSGEDSGEKISGNSHRSIPSSSSSSLSSNRTTLKNSNGDYSEGELFLPSSCAYSLGEVVMSSNNGRGIVNKICVNLSSSSSKIQPPDHSPGELLDTDIDSNSSLTSRGQFA